MRSALLVLLALTLACDPGPPKIDDVRIQADSYYRTDLFDYRTDSVSHTDVLSGLGLDGVSVGEGFAMVLRVQPIWKKFSTPEELPGALHVTVADPTLLDVVPVPNEGRRFILIAKSKGSTDVTVTVDGAEGSQKMPVTITAQTK